MLDTPERIYFMTILSRLQLHLAMVAITFVLFLTMVWVNEVFFNATFYIQGINWFYLPAGVRLLATLLFGFSGTIGLLLASWGVNFWYFFPHDFSRSFVGGLIGAFAPYMVYVMARHFFGLKGTLGNLTPGRLMICIVVFAISSPLMHHTWFHLQDAQAHDWTGFYVMALGDFLGSVVLCYALKLWLNRRPPRAPSARAPG